MIRQNLLPPEIKNEIHYAKKNAHLIKRLRLVIALAVFLVAFFGVFFFVLKSEESLAIESRDINKNQVEDVKIIEKESRDLSSRLAMIKKLNNEKTDWNNILSILGQNTPSGLRIQTLILSKDTKSKGKITGLANTARDIALFKDLLSKTNIFKYVDVESITEATASDGAEQKKSFVITLYLNAGKK